MIVILFFTRPYKESIVTWMAVFNEIIIFIMGCYCFSFLITDLTGAAHAVYASIMTYLLFTTIGVNLLVTIIVRAYEMYLECLRQARLRRLKLLARIERRF